MYITTQESSIKKIKNDLKQKKEKSCGRKILRNSFFF